MHKKGILQQPNFGISKISINNIGSIDSLNLYLTNKALLSLYASNGTGKTTVLECISLIGHLPCFPTREFTAPDIAPSILEKNLGERAKDRMHFYKELALDLDQMTKKGISSWLECNRPNPGANFGMVEFCLFDTCSGKQTEHKFAVIIHHATASLGGAPTLTGFLSRGDFDESASGIQPTDDRHIANHGLVVYASDEQQGQSFDSLLAKLTKGRTFHLIDEAGRSSHHSFLQDDDNIEPRSVSYINTDLNDFGRGNDLRESPKDLSKSFGLEMFSRIRIPTNTQDEFRELEELKRRCSEILKAPISSFSRSDVIPPGFVIMDLRRTVPGKDEQCTICVRRNDGSRSVPLSFLSAGENEVFFVLLLVLSFTRNAEVTGRSILILDEPDLHISNVAREQFFKAIIELGNPAAQLIVTTHSPALFEFVSREYNEAKKIFQVLMRICNSDGSTRLKAEYDGVYLGKLNLLATRRPFLSPLFNWFRYQGARTAAVLKLDQQNPLSVLPLVTWVLFVVLLIFLIAGALTNDVVPNDSIIRTLLMFGIGSDTYHDKTRVLLIISVVTTSALPLVVLFMRRRKEKRHQRQLEKCRQS